MGVQELTMIAERQETLDREVGMAGHERGLVALAKSGRSCAFGKLYERHKSRVYRTAFRVLRNRQDAEDAVQLCFQRALINLARFREESTFSTWVTRIAINEALMLLRQRKTNTSYPKISYEEAENYFVQNLTDQAPNPEQTVEQNELRAALVHAIFRLRKNLRSVVLLHDLQGLSSEETARRLGLTVPAVKARVFHARRCLRRHLEQKLSPERNGFLIETRKKELARLLS